jgi:hypothetical protein
MKPTPQLHKPIALKGLGSINDFFNSGDGWTGRRDKDGNPVSIDGGTPGSYKGRAAEQWVRIAAMPTTDEVMSKVNASGTTADWKDETAAARRALLYAYPASLLPITGDPEFKKRIDSKAKEFAATYRTNPPAYPQNDPLTRDEWAKWAKNIDTIMELLRDPGSFVKNFEQKIKEFDKIVKRYTDPGNGGGTNNGGGGTDPGNGGNGGGTDPAPTTGGGMAKVLGILALVGGAVAAIKFGPKLLQKMKQSKKTAAAPKGVSGVGGVPTYEI